MCLCIIPSSCVCIFFSFSCVIFNFISCLTAKMCTNAFTMKKKTIFLFSAPYFNLEMNQEETKKKIFYAHTIYNRTFNHFSTTLFYNNVCNILNLDSMHLQVLYFVETSRAVNILQTEREKKKHKHFDKFYIKLNDVYG